jgi:hypothetical protein
MAVPAFQAIVGLEPRPFVLSKSQPVIQKLPARIDGAEDISPDFL